MNEFINISLENEMDLILVHKKALKLAERLLLTSATQTTFATAVSEVCREIIDRTDEGFLKLFVAKEDLRYVMSAEVSFKNDIVFNKGSEGYIQAQKLVPEIDIAKGANLTRVALTLSLPRNSKVDAPMLTLIRKLFEEEAPYTAYEEIKRKNSRLNRKADDMDIELQQSRHFNQQKNEFISIASHELKTPVTIIKAFAQLALTKKDQCGPDIREFLVKIDLQAGKIHNLIQQLLDISKIENGRIEYRMEVFDAATLLNELIDLNRHVVPHHALRADIRVEGQVRVDKLRFEQVLSNVIGNAAKYSDRGTPILVTARVADKSLVISVRDKGIGISDANLEQIFDKFYRSDSVVQNYSGLGMGLYISSRIIAQHNGVILAESREGEGSVFTISIPVETSH